MLILSRKEKEEIVISISGSVIGTIHVIEIRGRDNTVRIGFEGFDKSIGINRREVHDRNVLQESVNATDRQDCPTQD